jgi:hypothetical protein
MFLGDNLPKNRETRRALQRATRGGVLLRPGQNSGTKIRNVETGRVFPCCWDVCERDANVNIEVRVNHEQPRWRDPVTGEQEKLIYTFCSEAHKGFYVQAMLANR